MRSCTGPHRRVHPTDPKIAAFRNEESVENEGWEGNADIATFAKRRRGGLA